VLLRLQLILNVTITYAECRPWLEWAKGGFSLGTFAGCERGNAAGLCV